MSDPVRKVVLAYSGGLDTSVIIPWLRETYGCQVVAVVVNVGQVEDFEAVEKKALASGAIECRVVDVRDAFVSDYAFPALRAGAVYEGRYLLGTALARPLIARVQVEVAKETGCDALAHGCTGMGNDQVRFDLTVKALGDYQIVAPIREIQKEHTQTRAYEQAYLEERGFGVRAKQKAYTINENLLGLTMSGGEIDRWEAPGEGALEGLRHQVLSQRPIAGPVGKKAKEGCGVLLIQALEVLASHRQKIPGFACQESGASFV